MHTPINKFHRAELWDRDNIEFNLDGYLKKGINRIEFEVKPSIYYSKSITGYLINPKFIEPVVLKGDFRVTREKGLYKIVSKKNYINTGPWEKNGYPHYCGTVSYSQEFKLNRVYGRYWIKTEKMKDVLEVLVNGKLAGIRTWHPYEVEITKFLKKGMNNISLKVTNTFGNLIRQSYMGINKKRIQSGLIDIPKIVIVK